MIDQKRIIATAFALERAIRAYEDECLAAGAYMPGIATGLRILADELAEKYPDDANGGRHD